MPWDLKYLWRCLHKFGRSKDKPTNDIVHIPTCSVYRNKKLISVKTMSGDGLLLGDFRAGEKRFLPDVENQMLGEAVAEALDKSRHVSREEDPDLWDKQKHEARYLAWIQDIMATYGFRTKSAMFKGLVLCHVEYSDSHIVMKPTKRTRGDGFEGTLRREKDYVTIPKDSGHEEIGANLRLALDRCIG
jgi:hypothetical protein